MNFNLEFQTIKELYLKRKNYLTPILIIIVCFILLIQITIPQITNLYAKQQEESFEKDKLLTLNKNLEILNSLDENKLDYDLEISTDALPIEKNFVSVINSINQAANNAGVILGDYEFLVGDLGKIPPGKSSPYLEISLSITGVTSQTAEFVSVLYKSLPIAEVKSLTISSNRSNVTAIFYYKPFSSVSDPTVPIQALSGTALSTLKDLDSWSRPITLESTSTSTESASSTSVF